jgi:hypothetical protein
MRLFHRILDSTRLIEEAEQYQYNQDQPQQVIAHEKVPQNAFPP